MKVTAALITLNEEKKIGDALRSVAWADEIVVVDSGSTDRTAEIAEAAGAKVLHREWTGFSDQKQFAADTAANDWVLSIDADERVSEPLRDEIRELFKAGPDRDGYTIPRLSFYMGKPIRHSGWYPDRQLRLFDRREGKWNGRVIHESFELNGGAPGVLNNDLFHYSVDDAGHHHRMIGERYAPLAARHLFETGKRSSAVKIATAGPAAFWRHFLFRGGFLDGFPGYAIGKFAAHHAFLKHLMLYEMERNAVDSPPSSDNL